MSQNGWKINMSAKKKKNISLKLFRWTRRMSFENPAKMLNESVFFFWHCGKKLCDYTFSREEFSPQTLPLDTSNAFLTTQMKNFQWKCESSVSKSRKHVCSSISTETFFYNENHFSPNFSSGHVECSFEIPAEFFSAQSPKVPLKYSYSITKHPSQNARLDA